MTKPLRPESLERLFVWRRVFRSPNRCIVRGDLIDAFGMSETKASNLLSDEAQVSRGWLIRQGYKVIAPPWQVPPSWADERDLMVSLDSGRYQYEHTGLTETELPVNYVQFSRTLPVKEGVFSMLVAACANRRSLLLQYVGIGVGQAAGWRRFFPIGLERMGDQWRVTGHDLSKPEYPIRTLVLARLTAAMEDPQKLPRNFHPYTADDLEIKISVSLDARFSPEQKAVIEHELGITQGKLRLKSRAWHDFKSRFTALPKSQQVVWPPLTQAIPEDTSNK